MILLLDTSKPICKMSLIDGDRFVNDDWQADRMLAKNLLSHLYKFLNSQKISWSDIDSIGVFKGPGSFTGLRIGLTVANTVADARSIPIVGASGENWRNEVLSKLSDSIDEKIVIPLYDSEARITNPRK